MVAPSSDFSDPGVRALTVAAGMVLYVVFAVPLVSTLSLPQQFGAAVAAILAVAAVLFRDRLPNGNDTEPRDPRPALTVGASVGAIILFEYGLGAVAPGVRDAIAGVITVAVAGAGGGLLLVGVVSVVRSVTTVWS
jgi:hypothetical protein